MNVRLVNMGVCASQEEIVLDALPATIGRGGDVQVRLDDPYVRGDSGQAMLPKRNGLRSP